MVSQLFSCSSEVRVNMGPCTCFVMSFALSYHIVASLSYHFQHATRPLPCALGSFCAPMYAMYDDAVYRSPCTGPAPLDLVSCCISSSFIRRAPPPPPEKQPAPGRPTRVVETG